MKPRPVWPLVGRDAEVAFAGEALAAGGGLALAGRAGVGKTRLASEIAARWLSDRRVVHAVGTESARAIPYGALAHLTGDGPDEADFAKRLRAIAANERLAIVVDDAHHLDQHSAALVASLVQSDVPTVVTIRSGMPVPDAIQVLWKDGYLARIDVQLLSRAEVRELVEQALDGPITEATQHLLFETTAGSPLYLRELVAAALRTGDLRRVGTVWQQTASTIADASLTDLVSREIGVLEPDVQRVLEFVAFAEPLEYTLLEALVGTEALAAAERSARIVTERTRRRVSVRFDHPLYGDCLRARTPAARAIEARRALAAAAAARPTRRMIDDLRRALWLIESDGCDDLELLIRAGQQARRVMDVDLVERFSEAGVQAGGSFTHHLGRAYAPRWRGQNERASEVYDELWEIAANDVQKTQLINAHPVLLFFGLEREHDALAMLRRVLGELTDPRCQMLVRGIECILVISTGEIAGARDLAIDVLHDWEALPPALLETPMYDGAPLHFVPDGRLHASAALSAAHVAAGELDEAMEFARSVRDLVFVASSPALWLVGEWLAEHCARAWGDRTASALRASEIAEFFRDVKASGAAGTTAMIVCCASLARGRPDATRRWGADAKAGLENTDLANFRFHVACANAVANAVLGDAESAAAAARDARTRFRLNVTAFAGELAIAEAWTSWILGDQRRAVAILTDAAAHERAIGSWGRALELEHEALRLGDTRAAGRVVDAAAHVSGPLAAARRAHAEAVQQDDGPELVKVADTFVDLGADLLALDALAHAVVAFRAANLRARAVASLQRMHELQTACEGAVTAATRDAEMPIGLTKREDEVARLAATGMSNRAIAERLVVSTRTVESHVAGAMAKLGVTRREELAAVFGVDVRRIE